MHLSSFVTRLTILNSGGKLVIVHCGLCGERNDMLIKETDRIMPLHVSSSIKLKREKSKEQLSECLKVEDKSHAVEAVFTQKEKTCGKGSQVENATLVVSRGQGTFKFELSYVLGR